MDLWGGDKLKNLIRASVLSYRALFWWLSPWSYLSNVFITPMLTVAIFGLLGRFAEDTTRAQAYLVGLAAYAMPVIVTGGIYQSFYRDRVGGTLSIVLACSRSRVALYISRALMHFPNGVVAAGSSLAASALFLGLDMTHARADVLIVSLMACAWSCTWFVLGLGVLCAVYRDWFTIRAITNAVLFVLTGVIIPRDSLPFGLAALGEVLPLTHGTECLREAISGSVLRDVLAGVAHEFLLGITYAVLGYLLFVIAERVARHSGVLEEGAL